MPNEKHDENPEIEMFWKPTNTHLDDVFSGVKDHNRSNLPKIQNVIAITNGGTFADFLKNLDEKECLDMTGFSKQYISDAYNNCSKIEKDNLDAVVTSMRKIEKDDLQVFADTLPPSR